ncbi:Hypothetical_protein [Hexamita inflata]|uniref:Hypothetical_protein n=1 Tax=Hexamita inflata TaxID=28002 RepID=A0AA86Q1T3_9EUKA|nr:Hypothetical protein HINF_LOCUS31389 [Hexamita inflata]
MTGLTYPYVKQTGLTMKLGLFFLNLQYKNIAKIVSITAMLSPTPSAILNVLSGASEGKLIAEMQQLSSIYTHSAGQLQCDQCTHTTQTQLRPRNTKLDNLSSIYHSNTYPKFLYTTNPTQSQQNTTIPTDIFHY